jgi:hypothetical protein
MIAHPVPPQHRWLQLKSSQAAATQFLRISCLSNPVKVQSGGLIGQIVDPNILPSKAEEMGIPSRFTGLGPPDKPELPPTLRGKRYCKAGYRQNKSIFAG